MLYYHATSLETYDKILESGELRPGIDGCIYLCTDPQEAARFAAIHLVDPIYVIEVDLNESEVEEQFDHNPVFFKCKAWGYFGTIPTSDILEVLTYTIKVD